MRTLTPGALAAKEARANTFDILIESAQVDLRYSLSTTTAGGHTWEQRLLLNGLGELRTQVEPGGGFASATTYRCTVIDDGMGKSPRAIQNAGQSLFGADLTVSLLFESEDYAEKIILFTGRILDVRYQRRGTRCELVATDDLLQNDQLLPPVIVSALNYPQAANDVFGAALPLLYGSGSALDPVPMLLTDQTGNGTYTIAGHALQQAGDTEIAVRREAALNEGSVFQNAVRFKTSLAGAVNVGAGTFTLTRDINGIFFGSSLEIAIPSSYIRNIFIASETDVTDAINAIDGSIGTAALLNTNTTLQNGDGYGQLTVGATFGTLVRGRDVLRWKVLQHQGNSAAATTVNARIVVSHVGASGSRQLAVHENLRWYSSFRNTELEYVPLELELNTDSVEVQIAVNNEGGLGGANDQWLVPSVVLDIGTYVRTPLEQLWFTFAWDPRPDDGSGTYTGTPGANIENAADVLHSILGQDLGEPVDTAAFVAARTFYDSSWTFTLNLEGGIGTGWFRERVRGREWLDTCAKQATAIIFRRPIGYTIVPYDNSVAVAYTFDLDTILLRAGTDPLAEVTDEASTFVINRQELPGPYHSYEVHGAYSALQSRFLSVDTANQSDSTVDEPEKSEIVALCAQSFSLYGQQPPLVVEGDYIAGREAEYLTIHLARYFTNKRLSVTFETSTQGLHLELGDYVLVSHPDLPISMASVKFEIHELVYKFLPVTAPDGGAALSFRVEITASAPEMLMQGAFEEDAFEEDAFETGV